MKNTITITFALLIASSAGWWLGRHTINPSSRSGGYSVFVSCGGGDYPKEAFTKVNFELPQKIDELVNEFASQDHLVAVIPEISGYEVKISAPSNSSIWEDKNNKALSDWISERMNVIQYESHQ